LITHYIPLRAKIKYHDFAITTRSRTVDHFVETKEEIIALSHELLIQPEPPIKAVRLLGITLSNLNIDIEKKNKKNGDSTQLTFNF